MRAILPGRPQSTRQALCTASWDGLRLVSYVSGDTIVVFDGFRNILQTIFVDDVESLLAITIEESSGRLAVCDQHDVYIYEPLGRDEGLLRWSQTQKLHSKEEATVRSLSWGSVEELLVGGSQLSLWQIPQHDAPQVIWKQDLANPVAIAYFSNDAGLIASCGQHDRLVKIWRRLSYEVDSTRFDVSYLSHPSTVTNLHWRKPWHAGQNLDNLLYTFSADNHIRVWAYPDPHAVSVIQEVAEFDMNVSIQPRRLSTSSITSRRFAFIVDSRDFSSATEKAIQRSNKQKDHALEHLIEVANRSPEICVVMDGSGHMSVWGLENAGYRNKSPVEKFNVALVDRVNMRLPSDHGADDDYIQFCSFAGGRNKSNISLLLHSFSGQIDWYESPIAEFFDTASREDRVKLVSSWSGHDSNIVHMVRGDHRSKFISWDEHGSAIVWKQNETGALLRKNNFKVGDEVVDVILLDLQGFALVLHPKVLSLWDIRRVPSKPMAQVNLKSKSSPQSMCRLCSHEPNDRQNTILVTVICQDRSSELWQIHLPLLQGVSKANGYHELLVSISENVIMADTNNSIIAKCEYQNNLPGQICSQRSDVFSISADGQLTAMDAVPEPSGNLGWSTACGFQTKIQDSIMLCPAATGQVAIVSANGTELSIWDAQSGVCEYQQKFPDSDTVEKLTWNTTTNGSLILAVCFLYHVIIIGQQRFMLSQDEFGWAQRQDIRIRDFTTHPIGDVTWLKDNDLVIGAGNQIFVVECSDSLQQLHLLPPTQKGKTLTVSRVIDLNNSVLPIYRPEVLHSLMAVGKHRLTQQILFQLHQELKLFTSVDELQGHLKMHIPQLICDEKQLSRKMASSLQYQQSSTELGRSVEGISEQLKDNINSAEIWQLPTDSKEALQNFLTMSAIINQYLTSLDTHAIYFLHAFYAASDDKDLPWSAIVSASFSTSQEAILEILGRYYDSKITWPIARRIGLFLWLSEPDSLRTQFENVARAEYNKHEDRSPVDCSLYYLALNKKAVLQGLWRRAVGIRERDNTLKLLANNFDEPRWKATALKNAYALISKRRFEYAAAWFLLGGSLKDAVNVCVKQMNDIQLGFAIARAWDRNADERESVLTQLINTSLLQLAANSDQGRWVAAWGYCFTDDYPRAIQAITRPMYEVIPVALHEETAQFIGLMNFRINDPCITRLYTHLRQLLHKHGKWTANIISPREERDFVMRCVRMYNRMGMPLLALDLVVNWDFVSWQEDAAQTRDDGTEDAGTAERQRQQEEDEEREEKEKKKKPAPTQFVEPSASSLLDSFGF